MPRVESEDTDITDDEFKSKPRQKSKKVQKFSGKVEKPASQIIQESRWVRFLRWCESSNNLGYLQGILVLNSFLLYGLHAWFSSQYGQDPLTFLSGRFINASPDEVSQNIEE